MPRLKKERYEKIIDDYLSGMTQREVGEVNGVGRDAVGNILRKFNIPIRDYTGPRQSNRKYFWDFEFFGRKNCQSAYWAGFIMADGNISVVGKNSYNLAIALSKQDREHLEEFCHDVGVTPNKIFIQKSKPHEIKGRTIVSGEACGIHLAHTDLGKQLEVWGIVPRKTYNFIEPQVSLELLPHYLRGWADGDGHIYVGGTGARFTVSGLLTGLEWYADALRRLGFQGHIGFQKRTDSHGVMYIGGKEKVQKIMELLLVEDNFKLERKWNKSYNSKRNLINVSCDVCNKEFGVPKFRYNHPTQGRFCSRECSNEGAKKPVIDEKRQCAKCEEWVLLEDYSANPSYCKVCWRKR